MKKELKANLEEWLEEMRIKVENNRLVWRNADASQNTFYLQQQIAIANEIELKKIELQYLNKEISKDNLPISIPKNENDNKYKITIT